MNTNNNYCLILAGGRGLRLWPYSRLSFPKQFVDFFGVGRSQLQQTFDRFAQLIDPSHILVSTNETYADIVRNQLPELPPENILAEPIYRSTAPSVAWASHRILRQCPEACLVVTRYPTAVPEATARRRDDSIAIAHRAKNRPVAETRAGGAASTALSTIAART